MWLSKTVLLIVLAFNSTAHIDARGSVSIARAYYNRGRLLRRQGELEAARSALNQVSVPTAILHLEHPLQAILASEEVAPVATVELGRCEVDAAGDGSTPESELELYYRGNERLAITNDHLRQ